MPPKRKPKGFRSKKSLRPHQKQLMKINNSYRKTKKASIAKKNAMLAKAFKATREARAKAIRKSRVREAFMHSTKGYTPLWRGGRGYAPLLLRRASRNAFYRLGYNTLYDHNNNQIAERATLARMLQNKARWKNFRNAVKKLKDNSLSLEGRRKMAAYSKMRRWREGRS